MNVISLKKKDVKFYIITMPDGKKIKFWFSGEAFEKVLKAYNIPYKKTRKQY